MRGFPDIDLLIARLAERDAILAAGGIRVLRFTHRQVVRERAGQRQALDVAARSRGGCRAGSPVGAATTARGEA